MCLSDFGLFYYRGHPPGFCSTLVFTARPGLSGGPFWCLFFVDHPLWPGCRYQDFFGDEGLSFGLSSGNWPFVFFGGFPRWFVLLRGGQHLGRGGCGSNKNLEFFFLPPTPPLGPPPKTVAFFLLISHRAAFSPVRKLFPGGAVLRFPRFFPAGFFPPTQPPRFFQFSPHFLKPPQQSCGECPNPPISIFTGCVFPRISSRKQTVRSQPDNGF